MPSKRKASSNLNRDNWNREDPPQEREESLAPLTVEAARNRGRRIITGRRRLGERGPQNSSGSGSNPFAGFAGFDSAGASSSGAQASVDATAVADVSKPAGASADDKYTDVRAVGGAGEPDEHDIKLGGSAVRRKSYVTAMTRLNEAFLWQLFETIEIAEPVKALLTRAQLKDLMKVNASTAHILTPTFTSYTKGLQEIEKRHPEFSIVFRKEIPGAGTEVEELEGFKKKEEQMAKASKQLESVVEQSPAPDESIFKKPAAPATTTEAAKSPFSAVALSFPFAAGNKPFEANPSAPIRDTSTAFTAAAPPAGFLWTKPSTSLASPGKSAVEDGTTDTVTTTSEPPKMFSFPAVSSAEPRSLFGKKLDGASNFFAKQNDGGEDVSRAVPPTGSSATGFSFGSLFGTPSPADASGIKNSEMSAPKPAFSFGFPVTSSFGSSAGSAPGLGLFGGTSGLGSTGEFKYTLPPAPLPKRAFVNDDEEEYEPPVVEQKAIAEEGSYFQAKVKMFYMVEGKYELKGVGFLFLKKMGNGDVQVMMRADNAAQNVLFNVKVVDGQCIKRLPRNDVLFSCVANPPHDPKRPMEAIPVLFRSGKAEEAETLFKELTKAVDAKSTQ